MSERTLIGKVAVDIPEVIPPRTVVVLRAADHSTPAWKRHIGRVFRVGYYRPKDGLDCIWLVNDEGKYEQTTDRRTLLRYFSIDKLSAERDYFGDSRAQLRRRGAKRASGTSDRNGKRRPAA